MTTQTGIHGDQRRSSPFSRGGVFAIVVVGAIAFFAILYMIGTGQTGPDRTNNGQAHAASNGLNGFSALVDLVEADGYEVVTSRSQSELETNDLLVLTPTRWADAEELQETLENREYLGPTIVILPKWSAVEINRFMEVDNPDEVEEGWVMLGGYGVPAWADDLKGRYGLDVEWGGEGFADIGNEFIQKDQLKKKLRWAGRDGLSGLSGELPTPYGFYTKPLSDQRTMIADQSGRAIVVGLDDAYYDEEYEEPLNWVVFVIEPDLMNNWGLADETRARAALGIVRSMGYGDEGRVVFDLTLNGFGGAMNLLTLAFQPPFLAATLCLLLTIVIIGWRAFNRFGPAAAATGGPVFGKARLVRNGADLIVRAGRLQLLAEPYIALSARRAARALGLPKADPEAIDAGMAVRLPDEPPFTLRAAELRNATKPSEILRAASALNAINGRMNA
ncbi:MAG: DUF4350 domain-containing protein [Pseudomonadota bacterium]|nr:DUF4350 domain-containing protein [Pseudomonadota bacterium]